MRTIRIALLAALCLFMAAPAQAETVRACTVCKGEKKVACTNCQGTGKAAGKARFAKGSVMPCGKCRGTGRRICFNCGGAGDLVDYPEATDGNRGFLKIKFEVRSRKNKPAPSWIEITVDDRYTEKIEGKGAYRVYDYKEIALAPGTRHRLRVNVYFGRAIAGFHDGEVFVHNLRIENGRQTTNEGAKRGILPRDSGKVEDWGEVYRGIYKTMEETGSFRVADRP